MNRPAHCRWTTIKHETWQSTFRTECGHVERFDYNEDSSPFKRAAPIEDFGPYCRNCGGLIEETKI